MPNSTTKKLDAVQKEIEQLNNRKKLLLQKQKAEERKNRTHRLCKRGGYLESKLPGLVSMTDEQFINFVDSELVPLFSRKATK